MIDRLERPSSSSKPDLPDFNSWQDVLGTDVRIAASLLPHLSEGVVLTDRHAHIVFCNEAFQAITGYSADEMTGRTCALLQGPDTDPVSVRAIDAAVSAGRGLSVEILNYRKCGEPFWNDMTISPVAAESGEPTHFIGITRDISDRKAADLKAAAIEAQYRFMFEHVRAGIVLHAASTEILYANRMAAELLGLSLEAMSGAVDSDQRWQFLSEDGALLAIEDYPVNRAVATRGLVSDILLGYRRISDGKLVWFMCTAYPVFDEIGQADRVVVSFVDVTGLNEARAEVEKARAAAEAAAEVKAQFLANMSHEIRTPLTSVLGFADLLSGLEDLPDLARTYLSRITTGGRALQSLVNDILDFSQIAAGEVAVRPGSVDPGALINAKAAQLKSDADRKGLALNVDLPDDLPVAVVVDADRLGQVLINLIGNGVKFTQSGSVNVTASYTGSDNGVLHVSVADTGIGIAADRTEQLFERFSQLDDSHTRKHGGVGLGLAIAKGLINTLGGTIGVESRLGQGSTFWITVPAPISSETLPPGVLEEGEVERPLRILLADDVAMNRELVSAMLSPFEVELVETEDGEKAVAAAETGKFDLILMDMQMPCMDGLAATRLIRGGSTFNKSTPILALSANVLPDQIDACLKAGMNDHIAKPISPEDLLGKIALWSAVADAASAAE